MRDMEARWLVRSLGSRWLPSLMALLVILVLVAVLLDRLDEAASDSEQLVIDLTERNMRTGLQLAVIETLSRGSSTALVDWVGQDPSVWLGRPPVGHEGGCSQKRGAIAPGAWCFDAGAGILWYRPRHEALGVVKDDVKLMGWRVVATSLSSDRRSVEGLRVESVTFLPRNSE